MQQADIAIKKALKTDVHKAFEMLYEHYFADLCVYALRFFDHADDAQDLVQQTLIRLWEQSEKLQNAEYLRTYIYRSVHNAGLNAIRSRKQNVQTTADSEFLEDLRWEFSDELVSREQCLEIETAIAELPSQCRTVLDLNRMQGLSYKEIAERLNISHRTVDSHITHATRFLRQRLKGISLATTFGLVVFIILKQ